jgi:DNA-binding GntR family transcriptional regulator
MFVFVTVDPRSDRAVYKQLADLLRNGILSGELPPGSTLPSENRLAQEQGVGREAVRQAVAMLRAEGLVTTSRGAGTRVRDVPERAQVKLRRGDRAISRMPVGPERLNHDVEEGVPVIEIHRAGGETEIHAGDRTELVGD